MKIFVIALAVTGLLYLPFIVPGSEGAKAHMTAARTTVQNNLQEPETKENSRERYELSMELYRDIIITAIQPAILKSLKSYYGRPVAIDLCDTKFLNIVRTGGYRTFDFIVKVRVRPFVGAHCLGVDDISIGINGGGVRLQKFRHIENYEIPLHLKNSGSVL